MKIVSHTIQTLVSNRAFGNRFLEIVLKDQSPPNIKRWNLIKKVFFGLGNRKRVIDTIIAKPLLTPVGKDVAEREYRSTLDNLNTIIGLMRDLHP
ncbi:MAG: hypothetical protein ABJA67_16725 [Chthonomonadales bacterium]